MPISWSKIAKLFSGRPLKLELVLKMYRKVGSILQYLTFEATDGQKCTVSENIAQRNSGSEKNWFEVEKTQISLDLEIFCDN